MSHPYLRGEWIEKRFDNTNYIKELDRMNIPTVVMGTIEWHQGDFKVVKSRYNDYTPSTFDIYISGEFSHRLTPKYASEIETKLDDAVNNDVDIASIVML